MRKLFSLFAAVLFAGSMMAEVVTINASDITGIESGATTNLSATVQGIQIAWEGAYYNPDNQGSIDIRVYAGKTLTLTASEEISKVEIVGYAKKDLAPTVNAGTITVGASYSSETTKKEWSDPLIVVENINAKSLTFTCNKQMRAYAIRLTLGEGDGPEPMAQVSVIEFTAEAAQGTLNDSIFFSEDSLLKLVATDTDNKMAIDANNAIFGDANAQEPFAYRLKSGGKSSSKSNLKLTAAVDGKLLIAARTGSNSETNRTVVVVQGTDTLYNKVVVEADTLDGKIYPFIMVDVKEGDVAVTYPVGSINFYAFALVVEDTPIESDTVVIDAISYGEVYTEDFAEYGAVDVVFTTQPVVDQAIVGDGYLVYLDIYPEDANDITGVYSVDSMTLDLDYSGADHIVGTDTTSIEFVDGTVIFQVLQVSVEQNLAQLAIVGELEAEDGTVFIISAATVVYYEFINEEGLEEILSENSGKTIKFVQNGQIYILKGNKVYGIRGELIR